MIHAQLESMKSADVLAKCYKVINFIKNITSENLQGR